MSVRKRTWSTAKGERTAWVVDYFDVDGKRRLKTFAKQADAKAWERRTGVELEKGTHVPDRASCTVSEAARLWLAACKANGLERSTTDAYGNHVELHIKPLIGEKLISKLSVPAVRAFEDDLRNGGRSEAMIKRVISSLGAIVADTQERGLASHNAVREMRAGRKGRQRRQEERHREQLQVGVDIPSPAEIKAFVGALERRWRPLLMTAVFTGLRASELRGLKWEDIDLKKREIHVRRRADRFNEIGSPKSRQSRRIVPLPAGLTRVLKEWSLACPKSNLGLVFPNGAGQVESHANIITRGLVPAMIAAGVSVAAGETDAEGRPMMAAKYTGLHALRHFYASWCINPQSSGGMGLLPKVVQERMGHASIVMTMDRYGHLFPRGDSASEVDAAERALLG